MRPEVGCLASLTFVLLLSLASAGCSLGEGETKAASSASATTATTAPTQRAFVRMCEASVYGTLDDPTWRKHSVIGGPLIFYSADQYAEQPASLFAPIVSNDGYYSGQKVLVLIRRGAVATVVVPESERRHARLLYNPADWNDRNAYTAKDGETTVRFEGCP